VTVVVDYQGLGGGIVVRCAPGSPATGFAALAAAGFNVEQVRNTPGFLCRIDGKPGPDRERCVNTPPASAYWSYWHASRGGDWVYSQLGAGNRKPPAGSVEGWSFAEGSASESDAPKPGIAPPPPPPQATPKPTTKPTPKPTAKPTQAPTPRPTRAPTPTPRASQGPNAIPTTPPATPERPSSTPSPTTTAATSAAAQPEPTPTPAINSSPSTPADVAAQAQSSGGPPAAADTVDPAPTSETGPPLGTLLGAGLVLLVAVAGVILGRRRRALD
jgi:hypothetical protein